jgi:DNA-binding beta-propeller fold protein YncE
VPRRVLRRLALVFTLALALATPAGAADPGRGSLTRLPGEFGCFKGDGARLWMPCTSLAHGQFDASSIALTPNGRFAYVVSPYSGRGQNASGATVEVPGGTIAAFSRDAATGKLTQLGGAGACIKDRDAPANGVTNPCQVKALGLTGAKTITVSPDGRHAYVASLNNGAIAAFAINATTGVLKQLPGADACVQDLRFPSQECPRKTVGMAGVRWVTVSPDGRSVYAAAPASDGIVGFTRNTVTGGLTPRQCIRDRLTRAKDCPATGVGLNYPRAVTVSPDGKSVYVASDSADSVHLGDSANGDAVSAFRRDAATGMLTQLPGAAACIRDMRGRPNTGCTTVGRGLLDAYHVSVSPDGRNVYVGSQASRAGAIAVFARDRTTGALTQLPGTTGCLGSTVECTPARGIGGVDAITISPDGASVYATGFYSLSMGLFARDPISGRLTQLAGQACIEDPASSGRADCPVVGDGLNGPRTAAVSPDGKSVYLPASTGGTISTFIRR